MSRVYLVSLPLDGILAAHAVALFTELQVVQDKGCTRSCIKFTVVL